MKGLEVNTACEISSWIPAPYRKLVVVDNVPVPELFIANEDLELGTFEHHRLRFGVDGLARSEKSQRGVDRVAVVASRLEKDALDGEKVELVGREQLFVNQQAELAGKFEQAATLPRFGFDELSRVAHVGVAWASSVGHLVEQCLEAEKWLDEKWRIELLS